jgi:hypothetical protein
MQWLGFGLNNHANIFQVEFCCVHGFDCSNTWPLAYSEFSTAPLPQRTRFNHIRALRAGNTRNTFYSRRLLQILSTVQHPKIQRANKQADLPFSYPFTCRICDQRLIFRPHISRSSATKQDGYNCSMFGLPYNRRAVPASSPSLSLQLSFESQFQVSNKNFHENRVEADDWRIVPSQTLPFSCQATIGLLLLQVRFRGYSSNIAHSCSSQRRWWQ